MELKKNQTILIVEDDSEISFMIAAFLGDEGFDVVIAGDGAQALEQLSNNLRPDLILLDMMMPVMDGFQFSQELRARHYSPCPVIVTSAAVDIQERAKKISANAWISKPFSLDELHQLVIETLAGS